MKSTCINIFWFPLLEMKPNQQGTSLTKRKTHSKKAENGHKSSLRPGSPHADKSDASDADLNGDAEEDDVSDISLLLVLCCCHPPKKAILTFLYFKIA